MSISGNLEDVSVGEVMQFIHLGRRTGTLALAMGDVRAEVGFHRGRIVSAWSPSSKRLGDLLVAKALLDRGALEAALRAQQDEQPRRSLGQILVAQKLVTQDAMRRAVEEQIEHTVYELVTWTRGTFRFALDDLRPVDDIAMYPGDIIPDVDLNTQMVLLEATRIFDERNRSLHEGGDAVRPEPAREPSRESARGDMTHPVHPLVEPEPEPEPVYPPPPLEPPSEGESEDLALAALVGRPEAGVAEVRPRVQVVSTDEDLSQELAAELPAHQYQVVRVPLRDAGSALPGEPPPIVVVDVRHGVLDVDDLAALRRARPRASLVAVVDSSVPVARAYEAGALAALPPTVDAIAACIDSLAATRRYLSDAWAGEEVKAGFAKIRRVVADIRSGLLSATMALNLMNIVSESVERAVLFLVRRDTIVALGAFGFNAEGRPLAEVTRGLKLEIGGESAFSQAMHNGKAVSLDYDAAALPAEFVRLVGRPHSGQVVVFPVLGSERVISLIYADNGPSSRPIEEIEILELATAQVGIAFENELLRRQLATKA